MRPCIWMPYLQPVFNGGVGVSQLAWDFAKVDC